MHQGSREGSTRSSGEKRPCYMVKGLAMQQGRDARTRPIGLPARISLWMRPVAEEWTPCVVPRTSRGRRC